MDVEVATVIASAIVLAIQHQRLAEEQRRLASVERRARTLEQSLKSARTELHQRYGFEQMTGRSPLFREALARAGQVARTEATVLITGESGTGKELVARAIHYASPRAEGPFAAVNCAALPDRQQRPPLPRARSRTSSPPRFLEALRRTHGHKSRAATLLGLTRFQLYARLKRHQLDVPPE